MEILIRDPKTKLFLNEKANWVPEETDAQVFLLPLDGLKFCVEHDIKELELTFRYPQYLPGPQPAKESQTGNRRDNLP